MIRGLLGRIFVVCCFIATLQSLSIDHGNKREVVEKSGREKLASLRNLMKNNSIEAYIVTSNDAHNSEYVAERDKRRQYITGFRGSAGTAVITLDKALLWTDGRYYAQALSEFDPPDAWTLMKDYFPGTPSIGEWLSDNLAPNSTIGFDPYYMSDSVGTTIKRAINKTNLAFSPIEQNLIDLIWGDEQPPRTRNKIVPHKLVYSGKISGDKVKFCFEEMRKKNVSALVITALDETAHLLNWRGSDIPYSPVFYSYVILSSNTTHIFVDESRVTPEARQQLIDEKVAFEIHPYKNITNFLKENCERKDFKKLWMAWGAGYALRSVCSSVPIVTTPAPSKTMKYIKNDREIEGMRSAHINDAAGIVKYFAWLEDKLTNHPDEIVTEITGAEQLEKFRGEQKGYLGPSFETLAAVGPHAAMIHYQSTPKTDTPITTKSVFLIDTGSQFPGGTTDVSRTLHFGEPTDFEKKCYTMVFKAQSNLAMAKFKPSTGGNELDAIARKILKKAGLEYLHGTGHGVGAYLNVHEIPPLISWLVHPDDPGFQAGMFTSNEPGYYEDGKFGIRLENVELVVKADPVDDQEFLKFETITLVPYQTKLLNVSLLEDREVKHLNDYHERCLNTLAPLLQGPENKQALLWLERETQPVKK